MFMINKVQLVEVEPVKLYNYIIETEVQGKVETWKVSVESSGFNSEKMSISNASGTYYSGDANGEYIFRVFEAIEKFRKTGWMK